MQIHVKDELYQSDIARYFSKELPILQPTKSNLLEILSEIIIGSKEVRYGNIPAPEHLVNVRGVIRNAIENDAPIPFLVPFGGIKADKTGDIDVAEFAAIKRLNSLGECVKKYYSQGVVMNVRIEDINALYLYGESSSFAVENYSYNLTQLIRMLRTVSLMPVAESTILNKADYFIIADANRSPIFHYLVESDLNPSLIGKGDSYQRLVDIGWKGEIPKEQRDFYVNRYEKLYPGKQRHEYLEMMAKYLAGSKARHQMKATAEPKIDGVGFIQLNYTQPVPGAPLTMFNNAIYYRTLPLSEARTHMPAWRSKGYLKINEHGQIKAKITNFHEKEIIDNLTPAVTELIDGDNKVVLRTDYLC